MDYPLKVRANTRGGYYAKFDDTVVVKAGNEDIKRACGIRPEEHWPQDGAEGQLNSIHLRVTPVGFTMNKDGDLVLTKSNKPRRAFAMCPGCRKWHCAGHLDQHMYVCEPNHKTPAQIVRAKYPNAFVDTNGKWPYRYWIDSGTGVDVSGEQHGRRLAWYHAAENVEKGNA